MSVNNYEEFCAFCDQAKCLRGTLYNANTCKTDRKRKRCFDKYKLKNLKQEAKGDPDWDFVKKEIHKRDVRCRLTSLLTPNEYATVGTHPDFSFGGLDVAHCVRRSQSKKLYYGFTFKVINGYIDLPYEGMQLMLKALEKEGVARADELEAEELEWLENNKH